MPALRSGIQLLGTEFVRRCRAEQDLRGERQHGREQAETGRTGLITRTDGTDLH